jgi:aarF domain-containing kinase
MLSSSSSPGKSGHYGSSSVDAFALPIGITTKKQSILQHVEVRALHMIATETETEVKQTTKKKAKTLKEIKEERSTRSTSRAKTVRRSTSIPPIRNSNDHASSDQSFQKSTAASRDSNQKEKPNPKPIEDIRDHDMKKRIHNINNIRQSRTSEELERSQARVLRAQQLLENSIIKPSLDNIATDIPPPSSPSLEEQAESRPPSSLSSEVTTVPDTYWYNGNLQQGKGDYVTRWARGVKVAEPLRKYDPIAAEKLLFRQPAKWLVRNIQIGFPLATWAGGVVYDILTNTEISNRGNRSKQLLRTISGLGPAIIKGGQALASRSDLLPSEYLEELQKLQDDVPRFSNEVAFETVEKELGEDFENVFELVYSEPIAAASIGQVYKARLRKNGDMVAIKIQRPKCEEVIALDLYVLRWWSGVANFVTTLFNRDIDVQSIIDDFGELIYRELDYVAEAANAQRFSELYASQVKDVFVPKVYSELTTSKVLTMEWVDGFRLTDNASLEEYGLDRKKLVDILVQCSLRQILENGYFHADPHLGNLLACKDGRLCYLDFGMMSYAEASQRNGFLLAVVHIVNRDWDELVRMYQRLGFIPEGTNLEPIAVALENSLPDALSADISELNFKNVVGKLGDIMYTYPFSLPPFYISIIRCLGVLEGLALQVDPEARILNEAYPYVASRVLTDPQDELQEALRRLALTSEGNIRWSRLERLLSEAKDSQGYDVTKAVDQLTNYLISDDGEQLLNDLSNQIVEGADSLGKEAVEYVIEASSALSINDEVAAAKAFTTLQELFTTSSDGLSGAEKLGESMSDMLPEPTPTMKQFWRIAILLGARGNSSDPSKLIPIFRKLSQEQRVQRAAGEVIAKLGERTLSRTLRAVFGLPPPFKN